MAKIVNGHSFKQILPSNEDWSHSPVCDHEYIGSLLTAQWNVCPVGVGLGIPTFTDCVQQTVATSLVRRKWLNTLEQTRSNMSDSGLIQISQISMISGEHK